ncbi:MAG: hypothetical protein IKR59_00840, partial [Lachnospiraceae bacterium]|nr:hypothetical protein [Lachnospiraceae bacterium]
EYTSAYGNEPQESLKYSSQGRKTSPAMGGGQNFDDMGTASFNRAGDDIYTERLTETPPDPGSGPGYPPTPGNPYSYPDDSFGGGENTKPKSRFSILIAGEIIAILAVGAVLVFLLLGKFDSPIIKKDTETETVESESRTSSPVRIVREPNGESNIRGLFPCGEGAGYAGGIVSAAMDGIRIAEAIMEN